MGTLVCYISGHGFGHAVRTIELVLAVSRLRPDLKLVVRTSLPRWFFDERFSRPFDYAQCAIDVGVVQKESITLDLETTLVECARLRETKESVIERETAALELVRPDLVLADIPALAFDIADRLGVQSVGLTNFSWDWIYDDYVSEFPAFTDIVTDLRRSYARCGLLLRLPFYGDLSAFPSIRDIPLIARRATLDSGEVRRRLGLSADRSLVLISFGGLGLSLDHLPLPPDGISYVAIGTGGLNASSRAGCVIVSPEDLVTAGVRHEDLLAASDAVMTKPGYGMVAECIANATPIVYTERGRFAEYELLVTGIREHLPHAFISNDDLRAGRWIPALEAVLDSPDAFRCPRIDGAAVGAAILNELL